MPASAAPDAANVRREFRAACKAAKIGQHWTPRELRHSFASLMSSSGVPVEEIARLAGHAVFQATGAKVRTAVRAPRMNAICERLVDTLRRVLFDRILILGEAHLRAGLTEYQADYNTATLGHRPARSRRRTRRSPATVTDVDTRQIRRKPILNGLVK